MAAKNSIFNSVLIVGCVIILISFAIRSSFGVFQIPIAEEFDWLRSEFSLAIALQNLAWGIGQPIFSAIAEKIGDRRAIILGGFTYAFGLLLSSAAVTPQAHQTSTWRTYWRIAFKLHAMAISFSNILYYYFINPTFTSFHASFCSGYPKTCNAKYEGSGRKSSCGPKLLNDISRIF